MAVETRYVVVRNGGKEVMTFADKKSADEYDRMLDIAEDISTLLGSASIELDDPAKEELSIYLAKNREEMLYALQAKKRPATSKTSDKKADAASAEKTKTEDANDDETDAAEPKASAKKTTKKADAKPDIKSVA